MRQVAAILVGALVLLAARPAAAQRVSGDSGPQNAIPVRCVNIAGTVYEACGGGSSGTSDVDDGSLAGGQTAGLSLGLDYAWTGAVWARHSLFSLTNSNATAVAIVDGTGAQITSFGGGTQYVHGVTQATPTGTIALGKDTANVLKALPLTAGGLLNVDGTGGTFPVTGTFWQATQPVSGTFFQATQPVSLVSVPTHSVNVNDGVGTSIPSSTAPTAAAAVGLNVRVAADQRLGTLGVISTQNLVLSGAATANSAVEITLDGSGADGVFFIPTSSTMVTTTLLAQYTVDGSTWFITLMLETTTGSRKTATIATVTGTAYVIEVLAPASATKVRITAAAAVAGTTGNIRGYSSQYVGPFAVGTLSGQREGDTVNLFTSSSYPQLVGGQDAAAGSRMNRLSNAPPAGTEYGLITRDIPMPSSLLVTGTAAVNTGVTVTLPAVAGAFHYITSIQIQKLYAVVGVAAAAGVIITTTNLPGGPAFTTEQLASVAGTVATVVNLSFAGNPLKSSVVNTATTIVCPAQLQTIWRVNVTYYTGS